MEVPTILDKNGNPTAKNDFITTKIINSYLGMLAAKKAAQEQYDKVIEEIKEQIELITQIDNFEHVGSSKQMAAKLVANKAKSLNLKLNSEKKYEPAA